MRVYYPSRIALRHVGGNTTYTRALIAGLQGSGSDEVRYMPSATAPAATAFLEAAFSLRRFDNAVLHFSADTGPFLHCRTPSLLTLHGVASRHVTGVRTPRQEAIWRTRVRSAVRGTDGIITVSRSSRNDIVEVFGCPPSLITVIPHGVEAPRAPHEVPPTDRVAALTRSPYILYVGNLEPRKNLLNLLSALRQPALQSLEMRLVVAGRPAWSYEPILAAMAADARVTYLGFVEDAERDYLFQNCAVFAFPSLYEGFGFPVLEALAQGAPVCTSSAGSLAEVAGPAKRFPDLSAEGIAAGLAEALCDEAWRQSVRAEGPLWSARFTWDQSVQAHRREYARVAGRTRSL